MFSGSKRSSPYGLGPIRPAKFFKGGGYSAAPNYSFMAKKRALMRRRRGVYRGVVRKAFREVNFVDLASAAYKHDTTGTIALVATIAQGASQSQRIGKVAYLKSVQIRGYAVNNTAATFNDCCCILVYDKQPTGSLPAITDVLNTANSRSFNNDVNSKRFKILRRWDFMLIGNQTTPETGQEGQSIDEYVKLKGKKMQFGSAGTGAIGDIQFGALYFISVGNTAAGTGDASSILGFRTRFYE